MTDPDADAIEELLSAFDSLYKYANDDGRYSRPNRARLVLETWLRDVRPVGLSYAAMCEHNARCERCFFVPSIVETPPDPSVPLSAIRALVQQLMADADDARNRGYLEAWNTYQVCANHVAALCPATTYPGVTCEACQRPLTDVEYVLGATKCGACQMAFYAALEELRGRAEILKENGPTPPCGKNE